MHAVSRRSLLLGHQIAIDGLAQEGHRRRQQLGQRGQGFVKRGISRQLVIILLALPKAVAAQANIPVAHALDKVLNRSGGVDGVIVFKGVSDRLNQLMQFGQQPAVKQAAVLRRRRCSGRRPAIDVGVSHKETVGVPKRRPELLDDFIDQLLGETARLARRARRIEIPAKGIGAVLVDHRPRVNGVSLAFGHFLPMLIEDMPQRNDIFIGDRFKEHGGDGMKTVEPAARLIDGLADVIGWMLLLKTFAVLARIGPLRDLHGAAVEPDIDDLWHAPHSAALAIGVGKGDLINIGPMQIQFAKVLARQLAQFFHAADAQHVTAFVIHPNRQRRPPITLAAQRPFFQVIQPVAKTPVFDMAGNPVDGLIEVDHLLPVFQRVDEPGLAGEIHQRRFIAPVVRVSVFILLMPIHQAALGQVSDDLLVGVLEPHPAKIGRGLDKAARFVDGDEDGQVVFLASGHVIDAISRRGVDDASAIGDADIISRHHIGVILLDRQKRIEGIVPPAEQVFALQPFDHLVFFVLIKHLVHQRRGQDKLFGALAIRRRAFHLNIVQVFAHGQSGVAGQSPRRRRPGQQINARLVFERKTHINAGIDNRLIAQRNFMAA